MFFFEIRLGFGSAFKITVDVCTALVDRNFRGQPIGQFCFETAVCLQILGKTQ